MIATAGQAALSAAFTPARAANERTCQFKALRGGQGLCCGYHAQPLLRIRHAAKGHAMPVSDTVELGEKVQIPQPQLVNLYGCTVGYETKIGAFVEIQKNAIIGARC